MIELERDAMLEKLLESYTTWYDVSRVEGQAPLVATAAFHEHGEKYVISRKAQLWAADRHEYVWFFSVPELTAEIAQACLEQTRAGGEEKVDPHREHMSTAAVAVFLCDSATDEATAAVKRCRYRKSFQFSLQGWLELHAVLINRDTGEVVGNSDGRESVKSLKDVLYPKPKNKGRVLRMIKEIIQ